MTARDLVAGTSLANVILIRAWFLAGSSAYFSAGLPTGWSFLGLILDFVLLSLVLALLSAWSRRSVFAERCAAAIIAVLLIIPFDWLLRHVTGILLIELLEARGTAIGWLIGALALFAIAWVGWLRRALLRVLPLVGLPLVLVSVPFGLKPLFAAAPDVAPLPRGTPAHEGTRVLWLLFDSLDQLLLEGRREGAPSLPAFERLMAEAFVAEQATVPGGRTLFAIPAMSTGRVVTTATPNGYDLVLRFDDGSSGTWREQESVFGAVRDLGYETGAAGWYHSYCHALPGQFDTCRWVPKDPPPGRLLTGMQWHVREAMGALSLLVREGLQDVVLSAGQVEAQRKEHAEATRIIADEGAALARRMKPGLAFVHYPVPHPPGIADLIDPGHDVRTSNPIFGNAVVADRLFASMRAALEADGRWDDMAVVVTADHVWPTLMPRDDRVPFIVKLPGSVESVRSAVPVSLVVLRDLLPRLVSGEIATPDQLAQYLEER